MSKFIAVTRKVDGGGVILNSEEISSVGSQADNTGHWATVMLTNGSRIDVLNDYSDFMNALNPETVVVGGDLNE